MSRQYDPVKMKEYNDAHKAEHKAWREANRDRLAHIKRQWYLKNRDKAAAYSKKRRAYNRDYKKRNRDKINEQRRHRYRFDEKYRAEDKAFAKRWANGNKEKRAAYVAARVTLERYLWVQHQYGLSRDQFDDMCRRYPACAICGGGNPGKGRRNLSIDHDHVTGIVRGLLCNRCNSGIGYLGDNAATAVSAARYLTSGHHDGEPWSAVLSRKGRRALVYARILDRQ